MPPSSTSILRVGIVPYLNMLPLIHGMETLRVNDKGLQIAAVPPSIMTQMMDADELDIGMLPVGALIERRSWPIIGRSMIGSDGPVRSVLLAGWGDPAGWRILHPDSQSRSSNALARVLLQNFAGLDLQLGDPVPLDPDWTPPVQAPEDEAFVLIGTRALRWRDHWESRGGVALDMGTEWKRRTGLPFVFATWVARPGLDLAEYAIPDWMTAFDRLKFQNMGRLAEIIPSWPGLESERQSPTDALIYLTQNIKFDLDERARAGLDRFLLEASRLAPLQPASAPPACG